MNSAQRARMRDATANALRGMIAGLGDQIIEAAIEWAQATRDGRRRLNADGAGLRLTKEALEGVLLDYVAYGEDPTDSDMLTPEQADMVRRALEEVAR